MLFFFLPLSSTKKKKKASFYKQGMKWQFYFEAVNHIVNN